MQRIELAPGYEIPRVINGGWQLSTGHSGAFDKRQVMYDLQAHIDAGFTVFDCGDIYTGVEELLGELAGANREAGIKIHTKYVPDLNVLQDVDFEATQQIIDRSLGRLRVDRLDMVQFHWWDFSIPRHVDVAQHLVQLQQAGKIGHIGVTNYDGLHLRELVQAGVPVVSNQVQCSVLDGRALQEPDLQSICAERGIKLLCYGVMAGGFLQQKYAGQRRPTEAANRSQTKYGLIIDEFGGWELFQTMLNTLVEIGQKYNASPSAVAALYVLQQKQVGAVIIGTRSANHLPELQEINRLTLDADDMKAIAAIAAQAQGPKGRVYGLERQKDGPHGINMRYDLNGMRAMMDARVK